MGQLSIKLRSVSPGSVGFWCPGCQAMHVVRIDGEGAWTWNRDVLQPTFSPSVLVRSGHYAPDRTPGKDCWCTWKVRTGEEPPYRCEQCHSFVVLGRIQFLTDCSHAMAGQTVDLPDLPPEFQDRNAE